MWHFQSKVQYTDNFTGERCNIIFSELFYISHIGQTFQNVHHFDLFLYDLFFRVWIWYSMCILNTFFDTYTLRKKGSKRFPIREPFWFQVELFLVPYRTLSGKGSTWNSKGFFLPGTKRVLPWTKKGPSKSAPMGTAEEPCWVLHSTFFSKSVQGS